MSIVVSLQSPDLDCIEDKLNPTVYMRDEDMIGQTIAPI